MFSSKPPQNLPQRKIRSKTRAFICLKFIVEYGSVFGRMKRYGKKPAITSVGIPTMVVKWACFVEFRIVNSLYYSSRSVRLLLNLVFQPTNWRSKKGLAYSFRVYVYSFYSRNKISTISFHKDSIFSPVIIFILFINGCL